VQRLVHSALVVKTVVIPTLLSQLFGKGHVLQNFSRTVHGILLLDWAAALPSLRRRGGRDIKKICEATFDGMDGVVNFDTRFGMRLLAISDHSVCAE